MIYIGIDPGLDGAVAIMCGEDIDFFDIPTLEIKSGKKKKREYNIALMVDIIRNTVVQFEDLHLNGMVKQVALEKVHSMPGQGVASMFSMGKGFGIWLGIIATLKYPLTLVTPQAWKKAMMDGMGKEKDASRLRAIQLFPQVADQLSRKKDHGRADALLIAEHLRRIN